MSLTNWPELRKRLTDSGVDNAMFVDEDLVNAIVSAIGDENLRGEVEKFVNGWLGMMDQAKIGIGMDIQRLKAMLGGDKNIVIGQLAMASPAMFMLIGPRLLTKLKETPLFVKIRQSYYSMIDELVKLANELDDRGFHKEADAIDAIIRKGV